MFLSLRSRIFKSVNRCNADSRSSIIRPRERARFGILQDSAHRTYLTVLRPCFVLGRALPDLGLCNS